MHGGSIKLSLIEDLIWSGDSAELLIGTIMYSYLNWLTLIFAFAYFKRFFMICISIIFAPVFSVMYAFGQQTKQMYTNWLKDFIIAVFVQPFHLVVYSVLLSIPMNISGGTGWENLLGGGAWSFMYALMAMSMIRPAEKWLRNMFGMDKGLAGMASYDSGMKTFQALAKAVVSVASAGAAAAIGGTALKSGTDIAKGIGKGSKTEPNKPGPSGDGSELLSSNPSTENLPLDNKEDISMLTSGNNFNPVKQMAKEDLEEKIADGQIDESKLTKGQKEILGMGKGETSRSIDAATVMINAGAVQMDSKGTVESKNSKEESKDKGEIKVIDTAKQVDEAKEKKAKEDDGLSLTEGKKGFLDKMEDFIASDKMNVAMETFKSLGSIGDTLYVDGNGPQDWKQTAEIAGMIQKGAKDKKKEELENEKANWANDKGNIAYMAEKFLPEMQKKYKDKKPEEALRRAEEKAKAELAKMSAYVEFGITDIGTISDLYSKQKQYGFTPREMIVNEAGFRRFNESSTNITTINQDIRITGDNHTTVQSAIPNAREYYNAGINTIDSMRWVDEIASTLNKSVKEAIKIDETLRKKGKIEYNGSNEEMKDVVSQINKHYNN